jgi:hypothetical protein
MKMLRYRIQPMIVAAPMNNTIANIHITTNPTRPHPINATRSPSRDGDPKIIVVFRLSASHVEQSNKTLRMQIRRLTRLTDAHSKKLANHEAAMALFFAYYNFCRVHGTLKSTPAKAAGLTTETWSLERVLAEASAAF